MSLKQLNIKNFQSHAETNLQFSDGVNVIVGHSDSGKSSIIRALRWVCWNKPSGNSFCSTWGGETSVELKTDKGTILRSKAKKDKYVLRTSDNRETLFEAFGTNVPEEIALFLNLDELNLQYQLDAPFLLSLSPGQVSDHFNRIAKLDQIGIGLSNVNKEIRELTDKQKYKTSDLESKEIELSKFEHLEKFEIKVEALEQLQNQLRALQNNKQSLEAKIYDYKQAGVFIEQNQVLIADEYKVQKLFDLTEEKNVLIVQQRELEKQIKKLNQINSEIYDAEQFVENKTLVNTLLVQYKKLNALNDTFSMLSKLIISINNISNTIKTKQANLVTLQDRFDKLMPDICPLCGQSIKQ